MKIKSFLVTAAMALAAFGASAGTATFNDGLANFVSDPIAKTSTSFTQTISFTGLTAGNYDVEGDVSSTGLSFTSIMLDGHAWNLILSGTKYKFGEIAYTGTQPLLLTLVGTKAGNVAANFNGSITATAVTPVPEPETYAMLLAGLGLMGAVARRRKSNAA